MSLRRLLRRIRLQRKPHSADRHILFFGPDWTGNYEYRYHATKGWRRRRR